MMYIHKWLEARSKTCPPYVDRQNELNLRKALLDPSIQRFDMGTSSQIAWVHDPDTLPIEARHLPYPIIILQLEIEVPHDPHGATGHRRDFILCQEGPDDVFATALSLVSLRKPGFSKTLDVAAVVAHGLINMATRKATFRDGDGTPNAEEMFESAGNILWSFLSALNCTNVVRVPHGAPEKLNAKRAKGGKPPLCSFWTLHVGDPSNPALGARTGSHDSPRLHLRRGHARQYSQGKFCWVQPHIVGRKDKGLVLKDYAVRRKPEGESGHVHGAVMQSVDAGVDAEKSTSATP